MVNKSDANSLRSLVSYRVKHSKRNSISTRAYVLFSISVPQTSAVFKDGENLNLLVLRIYVFYKLRHFPDVLSLKASTTLSPLRLQQKVFFSVFSLREAQGKRRKMRVHSGMSWSCETSLDNVTCDNECLLKNSACEKEELTLVKNGTCAGISFLKKLCAMSESSDAPLE